MKRQWNIVLLIALILVVVIFSVLNVDPVAINFGFDFIQVPLAIVIIATLLIGVLIAVILSTSAILKNKSEQKKLNRRYSKLEEKSRLEKEELNQIHKQEIDELQVKREEDQTKIRELERHIQNLQKTKSAYENNQNTLENGNHKL